jgi:RNA polymerase sigma-70 factor, ECF subfamily
VSTIGIPTDLDPGLRSAFEEHRRALTGYCYRMLGSPSEADDAVQDTLLKAWQSYDRFEGRSSVRSWLYRIAHNVCIDMHRSPQRRARPMEMGPSQRTADVVLGPQLEEHLFVQPVRDEEVLDLDGDPADVATARESIRLAFVAALQHLPAKQRSALLLCDVLRWPAAEVAELLETTVASVNSALQRARATLDARRGEPLDTRLDPEHQALLARYVDAFERYDIPAVVQLMRDDAALSMPPWDTWIAGRDEVGAWMLGPGIGCKGSRLVPVDVNGTAGFAAYKPGDSGRLEPWAIQVIEVAGGRIVGHHNFIGTELFERFGLPASLPA